jgi:hypothetical protein
MLKMNMNHRLLMNGVLNSLTKRTRTIRKKAPRDLKKQNLVFNWNLANTQKDKRNLRSISIGQQWLPHGAGSSGSLEPPCIAA